MPRIRRNKMLGVD